MNEPRAPRLTLAAMLGFALLPGLLTVYLGFQSGGFFPGAPALLAAELAALLALMLALSRQPLAGAGPALAIAAVSLAGFAAWTLLSSDWSGAPARAVPEHVRVIAYLMALLVFGTVPFSVKRIRWMVYGLGAAAVVVCAAALVSHTLPDLLYRPSEVQADRLSYPLDYWNALGLLAGLGIVLCGHCACDVRGHRIARVAGAAAVPLLSVTLFYTFSRGATWATLVAVAVYVVLGRPRGLVSGVLATVPTTAVALIAANPATALSEPSPLAPSAIAAGHEVALVVAACTLAAAGLRALMLPLDARFGRIFAVGTLPRPLLRGAAALALLLALGASVTFGATEVVAEKYRDFSSDAARPGDSGSSRLLSGSDNGRREHWRVAIDAFHRDPLRGEGAGTYEVAWARDRAIAAPAHDAHSLYLETLGELGIPGMAALALCLLVLLGGFAARARGDDRALFAALLAAGLAWVLAAAVDWAWEMPAVTLWLFALGGAALARSPRSGRWRSQALHRRGLRVALRAGAVAACVLVALLPARLAVSEAHLEDSIERLQAGDCRGARTAAHSSLRALGDRAVPHHVIGFCALREGRYEAASRALAAGLREDPQSWPLRQASAVARAAAGRDPRPDARRALELNPSGELVGRTSAALAGERPRRWRSRGRNLEVALPELRDP